MVKLSLLDTEAGLITGQIISPITPPTFQEKMVKKREEEKISCRGLS